jgi:hypothetical protein
MTHSNHSENVSIRRFRESDLDKLVRLIIETIGISYAGVYPPRAVQFFKDFHSEKKIADRSKIGTTLVVEEDGELVATGGLGRELIKGPPCNARSKSLHAASDRAHYPTRPRIDISPLRRMLAGYFLIWVTP